MSLCFEITQGLMYTVSQNKGSPNRKNIKIFVALYGYNILHDINVCKCMLTIIDPKIIEFELLVFDLCPFLQKYPKIKFSRGSLHSKQVITAIVSASLIRCKSHLNTPLT